MRIDILTLFPHMLEAPLNESILKRAQEKGLVSFHIHQLRDWAIDKHGTVDDKPYGGGAGMVLKVDVIDAALKAITAIGQEETGLDNPYSILMTPQGELFKQSVARSLSQRPWLILICGHYEGFDERVRSLVDAELSIGDYVLTGGELPALVITDAVCRLLPDVLGKEASHQDESHEHNLLEYPHYTRPETYNGQSVPEILLSGNHAAIEQWRREQAKERTAERRPDLLVHELDKTEKNR